MDVQAEETPTVNGVDMRPNPHHGLLPHMQPLYDDAVSECTNDEQKDVVASVLRRYATAFSAGEYDLGKTTLAKHSNPLNPGTRPIRLPAHRLGPEKEAKVAHQLVDLKCREMVTPACGAWPSLVVLVRKKDGTWRFCVD